MSKLEAFQCPACGANIKYEGGPDVTILCPFCSTSIVVPEALRTHPAPAPQPAAPASAAETYAPEGVPGVIVFGPALQTAVADWLLLKAYEQTGIWVADEPTVRQRMANVTQTAMRELKTAETFDISMPFLTADANGPKHFAITLTRTVVDALARTGPIPLEKPPAKQAAQTTPKPLEKPQEKKKGWFGR